MNKPRIQQIVQADGTVTRLFACDCGEPLYRKNLTTGEIGIRVPDDRHQRRFMTLEPAGNPSTITLACSSCGMKHVVVDVRENTTVFDDVAVSEDVIE